MPRPLRLDYPGAIHHVYNRGNYRQDVFAMAGAARAFETCVFEACERCDWRLHAYTTMTNHYHLALETPRGNLVAGMQWLQSTYASRFNRFRKERGHLFQGRYGAVLVEPGEALLRVVNYIHLNPVKAKLVTVDQLAQYPWSSFRRFVGGARPGFLVCEDWLAELELVDNAVGWASYRSYLTFLSANDDEQRRQAFDRMSKGWAVGSPEWRQEVALVQSARVEQLQGEATRELKEVRWARVLKELLKQAGRTRADVARDAYGAEWKVRIAAELRRTTTATNAWIARELVMGCRSSVSVYLSQRKFKN